MKESMNEVPGADISRWLPIQGCVNFRDLGGYPNRQGQTVRWRRLYRSDALQDLTPQDAAYATQDLDIGLIVDLRNSDEAQRDGIGPLPQQGAKYQHFPLLQERGFPPFTGSDVVERLSSTYLWLLHNSGPRIANAITAIANSLNPNHAQEPTAPDSANPNPNPDPAQEPTAATPAAANPNPAQRRAVVFHCSAGKDRTGLLAALILEILDVDPQTITADYLLTNQAVDGILRRIQAMQPNANPTTQSLAAQPAAFQAFQNTLRQQYNNAESYLQHHGATPQTLQTLRRNLLE